METTRVAGRGRGSGGVVGAVLVTLIAPAGRSMARRAPHPRPRSGPSRSAAGPTVGLTLRRAGRDLYLDRRGGGSLLLMEHAAWAASAPARPEPLTLPDGSVVSLPDRPKPEVVATRDGREVGRISLNDLRDRWLKDDRIWGGHATANGVRYSNAHGGAYGGYGMSISEPQRLGGSIYGVLNFLNFWASDAQFEAQMLVRIDTRPRLMVRPVRLLVNRDGDTPARLAVNHLIRSGSRLLLNDRQGMFQIMSDGSIAPVVPRLPGDIAPGGLVDGRWLVTDGGGRLWTVDLRSHAPPKAVVRWGGEGIRFFVWIPPTGSRFFFAPPTLPNVYLVAMPRGRMTELPVPDGGPAAVRFWRGMAILKQDKTVLCCSAAIGRVVQRLSIP